MAILVDDIIPPLGRFVERATVEVLGGAQPTRLISADPVFSADDATKLIAIPGAVDLEATIVGLGDQRAVRNATISADFPDVLSGQLFDPKREDSDENFQDQVHRGRRVTVEQAGADGSTLLTTIVEVKGPHTVRLADGAENAVTGVNVVVNRPDLATLSNYARREVADLVVDLGRTIDDGAMELGARGLHSATAAFSSLDLDKHVTIRAAGLHVTTIHAVVTATQVDLTEGVVHPVDGVPVDVWQLDESEGEEPDEPQGFDRVLQRLDEAGGRGEIVFGPGVWDFARPHPDKPINGLINLRNRRDVTLRGAGEGATILRLMPNQDLSEGNARDTHVLEAIGCRNLAIRDLSVHGAYLSLANAKEQMHGIVMTDGCEAVKIERVRVFQTAGDGIRFLGRSAERTVTKVWVDGCRLIQNKRSGVAFQRGVRFVWVRNCYIEMTPPSTDQCIDFEPSRLGDEIVAPSDVFIESNVLVHESRSVAVAISGVRGADPARRVTFAGNVVHGGEVFCTDVAELTFRNNVVLVPPSDRPGRILLNLQRGGDSVLIKGNLLVSRHDQTTGAINLGEVNNRQVSRALVTGNICIIPAGFGIQVTGSDDIAVQGNMLVATGPCANGVRIHSETSSVNHVSVRGNDITVDGPGSWQTGIRFVAGKAPIHHVSALGNSFTRADTGIEFRGNTFTETPVCALNRAEGEVARPFAGLAELPGHALVVGGGASRGGASADSGAGRALIGVGDPNDQVLGNVGDVYQRLDQDATNPVPTFYVKEKGDDTDTDWSPK